MRILRRLAILAVVLAILTGAGWWWASRWRPDPHIFAIQGVDVSAASGGIDWYTLGARGVDFAYVRATIGADARDSAFERNWAGTAQAGLRRGALHVFSLCRSARAQAGNFVRTVPRDPGALPSALELDFHSDCAARPDRTVMLRQVLTFLKLAERHMGKPMVVNISPVVEARYHLSGAIPRTVWADGFWFRPDYMKKPWAMWRASGFHRVDGAEGPVNWDVVAP